MLHDQLGGVVHTVGVVPASIRLQHTAASMKSFKVSTGLRTLEVLESALSLSDSSARVKTEIKSVKRHTKNQ